MKGPVGKYIERRRHPRLRKPLEIILHLEKETLCGVRCRDLSLSGMLLMMHRDINSGKTGRVELFVEKDNDLINFSAPFKIVRKDKSMAHAFGIEFTDMTPEGREDLSAIIDYGSSHLA